MLNIYNQKNGNHSNDEINSAEGAQNKKNDFTSYIDPTDDFSSKDLKRSLWFVEHRVLLYRVAVGLLIGLSVIFWLFTLVKGANILLYSLEKGKQLDRELSSFFDYTSIQSRYTAESLLVAGIQVFPGGVNKYDLIGEITNPNERFFVSFDYYFIVGDEQTLVKNTFLLPGETRPVHSLGFSASNYPNSVEIVLENIKWKRISNHFISDVPAWQAERLNFVVSDFTFLRAGGDGLASANIIKFNLKNNSPFSFRETNFLIGLYQNNSLVGFLPLSLNRFRSGETRLVDLRSFVNGLNVTDIGIFPVVDIYDYSLYLQPES